jgi:hypothetical protein
METPVILAQRTPEPTAPTGATEALAQTATTAFQAGRGLEVRVEMAVPAAMRQRHPVMVGTVVPGEPEAMERAEAEEAAATAVDAALRTRPVPVAMAAREDRAETAWVATVGMAGPVATAGAVSAEETGAVVAQVDPESLVAAAVAETGATAPPQEMEEAEALQALPAGEVEDQGARVARPAEPMARVVGRAGCRSAHMARQGSTVKTAVAVAAAATGRAK